MEVTKKPTNLPGPKDLSENHQGLSRIVMWCDIDNLVYYTLDSLDLPQESKSYVRVNSFTHAPAWMAYPTGVCSILREIHCRVTRSEFVEILHKGLDENGELSLTIDDHFHLQVEIGLATWCITCQ